MEYPEEIYYVGAENAPMSDCLREGWTGWGRRHAFRVGYEVGKAEQADPLAGYSNLTAAISAGEPIDYEKLDGLKVKCVNPDVGTNRGTLERRESAESDSPNGWWKSGMDYIYVNALTEAWCDEDGWSLWVEGEVPLRRKTADQLKIGTYFRSSARNFGNAVMYVGNSGPDEEKSIHFTPSMTTSGIPASEWVVIEELGTFQKPEEKK